MLNLEILKNDIEAKIMELEREYQRIKGLILTESDLKCLIYNKLYPLVMPPSRTSDEDILSIALHTEIPWYDENDQLTLRPDITILDPINLSIKRGVSLQVDKVGHIKPRKVPSKGFSFEGPAIIIELKFIKKPSGITETDIRDFEMDVEKFNRLARRNDKLYGLLVIFNKTDKQIEAFNQFYLNHNRHPNFEVIYCSGHVVT